MIESTGTRTVGVAALLLVGITVIGVMAGGQGAGIGSLVGSQNALSEESGTDQSVPEADAGADASVPEQTSITLTATNSTDPDNDDLAYTWTQTNGPSVTLQAANSATPTLTTPDVDSATTFEFEVRVADGDGNTDTDTVTVIVQPLEQPDDLEVVTSQDRTVVGDGSVQLSVGESTAPTDESLSYNWTQTGGPAVTLDNETTSTPSFTTPDVDTTRTLTFEVEVEDGVVTEVINVTVEPGNDAPNATIIGDELVAEDNSVTLGAGLSSDPNGDMLAYEWNQTAGPEAETGVTSAAALTLTAPRVSESTNLTFELTVSDGNGGIDTEETNVTVIPTSSDSSSSASADSADTGDDEDPNAEPRANAGQNLTVAAGSDVSMDASQSSDPDGDALSYSWVQTAGPAVDMDSSPVASFTAPDVDTETTLTFEVAVTDGSGELDTDRITVTVEPAEETEDPTYYQVDLVAGEPLTTLGPEDSDNFYNDQERLIQYLWGSSETPVTERGRPDTLGTSTDQCIDTNDITVDDGTASVSFTVEADCDMDVSLVSYEKPGPGFSRSTASEQELVDSTTVSVGPGTHTLIVDLPD